MMEKHNDLLTLLRKHVPNFDRLLEQNICDKQGRLVGWSSHLQLSSKKIISSGTHADRFTARRIAISEALERLTVRRLYASPTEIKKFQLDLNPSSSGFAAGFENDQTRFRSICEGLERWAWSKWIDDGYSIQEVDICRSNMTPLGQEIRSLFDNCRFFKKDLTIKRPFASSLNLSIAIVLCYSRGGVYSGSRVSGIDDDLWTHGMIEARRNMINNEILTNTALAPKGWFMKRVNYFGKNALVADLQISKSEKRDWPKPLISLNRKVNIEDSFYVWRTLFADFVPWHEGPENRFVY